MYIHDYIRKHATSPFIFRGPALFYLGLFERTSLNIPVSIDGSRSCLSRATCQQETAWQKRTIYIRNTLPPNSFLR